MRIHSDKIRPDDLYAALPRPSCMGLEFTGHGSRQALRAYEVHLWWTGDKVPGDGRRHTNTGHGGAGAYALTWDEWGWWIEALYELDPQAVIGPYNDREHFYQLTERESQRCAQYGNRSARETHQAGWLPWRREEARSDA